MINFSGGNDNGSKIQYADDMMNGEEEKKSETEIRASIRFRRLKKLPWKVIIRWILFTVAIAAITAMFPRGGAPQYSDFKLNFISSREIIAPFDFELLKSEEELKREREDAQLSVLPVFVRSEDSSSNYFGKFDSLMTNLQELLFEWGSDSLKTIKLDSLNRKFNFSLTPEIIKVPRAQLTREMWKQLVQKLREDLSLIYKQGVLDSEFETLNTTADAIVVISKGVERRISFYSIFSNSLAKSTVLESLKRAFPEGDKRG